jgi:hypothetical protein
MTMSPEGYRDQRHRFTERTAGPNDEEYTEHEEQPPAEDEPLMDLRGFSSMSIGRLRTVPEDDWFGGDTGVLTITQKSLMHSWNLLKVRVFEHRTLDWPVLKRASGGANISAYFERFKGLSDLVSQHSRYVEEWVQVFYATLWVPIDRSFISFVFENHRCTITREELAGLLGVDLHPGRRLHNLVYGDARPPRRALVGANFPTDEEVITLFGEPMTVGTSYRTPTLLNPEAKVVHKALRRTLLPRIPNDETITSLQQWLLLCIMTGQAFDIVDFLLSEIEDVIFDGMFLSPKLPYAHFISFFLSKMRKLTYEEKYKTSSSAFPPYTPASLRGRRRGQRDMIEAIDMPPTPTADQCAGGSQPDLQVELPNPNQEIVLDVVSESDDDDIRSTWTLPAVKPDADSLRMRVTGQKKLVTLIQQRKEADMSLFEHWVMRFRQLNIMRERNKKIMAELVRRQERQYRFTQTAVQALQPALANIACLDLLAVTAQVQNGQHRIPDTNTYTNSKVAAATTTSAADDQEVH